MRLPNFIIENIDQIIAEWKVDARLAGSPLGEHAKPLLMAIAADIRSTELPSTVSSASISSTAATMRVALRGAPDFSLQQICDALRLLRVAVSASWKEAGTQAFDDLHRFNAAVDAAIAEAVSNHALQVERTRSLFFGMLGHDLRTPLSAISMACQYLQRDDVPPERKTEAVVRVGRCAATMEGLIRDVLDFARSRLGKSMTMSIKAADIGAVCRAALDDARATHPRCEFRFDAAGDLDGNADAARLRQALWNLLDSAAKGGAHDAPILFSVRGEEGMIALCVKNEGPALSPDVLRTMFDPIAQLAIAGASTDGNPPANLGLELFIAREIVRTHQGELIVRSPDTGGMEFTVMLPRG